MATIKEAAAALGVTMGVGPVDPTGPTGTITGPYDWGSQTYPDIPFPYRWPLSLDTATDANAALIVNEFGGMLDLCPWAVGNTDATHFGSALRWTAPGVYDFSGCDETYAFAMANGMKVTLSDPAYAGVPAWIQSGGYTPAQITAMLHAWYTAWFTRFPNIHIATMCNELLSLTYGVTSSGSTPGLEWWYQHADIGAAGGKSRLQYIDTVFRWVRALNPGIILAFNQYGCEGFDAASTQRNADLKNWLQDIQANGTPIDGIGLQSHFRVPSSTYNWPGYTAAIQNLAALGLRVIITELDIGNYGAGWSANYYGAIHAILASRRVREISFWCPKDPLFEAGGLTGALYSTNSDTWSVGQPITLTRTAAADQVLAALQAGPAPMITARAGPVVGGAVTLSGYRVPGSTVTVTRG